MISFEEIKNIPKALPKGLLEYVRKEMLPCDNVLLYDRDHPKLGYCYLCGAAVRKERGRFRQGEVSECPSCGEKVWTYLRDGVQFSTDYVGNVMTIQKGKRGVIWLREWHVRRGEERGISAKDLQPTNAWAIKDADVCKWMLEEKISEFFGNVYRHRHEEYQRSKRIVYSLDGFYNFYLSDNWDDIVAGTSLQYLNIRSALEKKTANPLRLILDWVRFPAVEKLQKAGFTRLVYEKLSYSDSYRSIGWKQNSIERALGFPLYLADSFGARSELSLCDADALKYAWRKQKEQKIRLEDVSDVALFIRQHHGARKILDPVWGHISAKKILRYFERELRLSLYRDYLRDIMQLGLDMDDPAVLLPKDLSAAHQRTFGLIKYKAKEENKALWGKRLKKLSKMAFETASFRIRPAASEDELIEEGSALHHCVAGYADRMAKGQTAIFVIRRLEDPGTPFFTLEYRGGQVVQCRTQHNRSYETEPAVKEFVQSWLSHLAAA